MNSGIPHDRLNGFPEGEFVPGVVDLLKGVDPSRMDDERTHRFVAQTLVEAGDRLAFALYGEALALRLKGNALYAWCWWAYGLMTIGHLDKAKEVLQRGLVLDDSDAGFWFEVCRYRIRTHDIAQATLALCRSIRSDPKMLQAAKLDREFSCVWRHVETSSSL
ncbi:tetratricopeptide repeat protein [Pelagicoccus mobilis]|uniref:Tetratricopeptide repeat protein n=1 Tax=Pelagicoccus mobilis TaxID=415221 RepID=A0A934RR89_9BACT|nr:hypothetical protein [Pelagicoccus mobilis]MBK1876085.1 hypothetical protein [Pelagicoccus mobilis]